jgi:uncharacterized RDD family membrane protein YckC
LIDTFPFGIGYYASLILLVVRWHVLPGTPRVFHAAMLVWLAAYVLYHAVGNAIGCTVGKRLLGLRVVGLDGNRLGIGKAFIRALGLLLISTPLFNLGCLWAFVNPQSRAWHDLLASSQVIESEPQSPAQSSVRALLAFLAFGAMLALIGWFYFFRQTPWDAAAIEKARNGLKVLAQIEEQYKAKNGTYTNRLADLAAASGDVDQFRQAMREIFDPDQFRIRAGKDRYVLGARAKDRRKTVVILAGP